MSAVEPLEADEQFSSAARSAGRAARARRALVAGRAEPARRDPERYETRPSAATLELIEAVIDADPRLVEVAADALEQAKAYKNATDPRGPQPPGRHCELDLRTALVAFLLLADKEPNFHLLNLPGLLGELPAADRRRLGIDRQVKVPNTGRAGEEAEYRPAQVTYRQLLGRLHALADAFDPTLEGLDPEERVRRAAAQQEFILRTTNAARLAMLPDWQPDGSIALDATLKWAWDRPPGVSGKLARRGADGDAGPPRSLSEILDGAAAVEDAGFDPFAEDDEDDSTVTQVQPSPTPRVPGVNREERRRLRRRWRRLGPAWVGRPNPAKSVYGYATHTLVNGGDGPCVILHAAVTPAPANPAGSVLPLLRHLYDDRAADGVSGRLLGDVVADGAYSAPKEWQLSLRALGASPVFRLHPTAQEGRRLVGDTTFLNGRPICACCPTRLDEPWPAFRHRPTRAQIAAHHLLASARGRWEWKANGPARPDGSRQFLAPHRGEGPDGRAGGCENCVTADGRAVIGADGLPIPRCCMKPTKVFSAKELVWYQDQSFGTKAWYEKWNVRDRAEGTYGAWKNLGLVNYGRDYHHFVGQGHEAFITAFAVMAHNIHMIASWLAKEAAAVRRLPRVLPLPSATPTETIIGDDRVTQAPAPQKRRAPKGLPELAPPDS